MHPTLAGETGLRLAAFETDSLKHNAININLLACGLTKLQDYAARDVAKRMLEIRDEQALEAYHREVKTFLGVLAAHDLDIRRFRHRLRRLVGTGNTSRRINTHIPRDPATRQVFEQAATLAQTRQLPAYPVSLLFAALLASPAASDVHQQLRKQGVDPDRLRVALITARADDTPTATAAPSPVPPEPAPTPGQAGILRERLSARILGQTAALEKLVTELVRLNALQTPSQAATAPPARSAKTAGVLVFSGPSGTGKTEVARVLATVRGGTPDHLIHIDCNYFTGANSVAQLTGSDDHTGLLTEGLASHRVPVILFERVDKAHADVVALIVAMLATGQLKGRDDERHDASGALVVLTTTTLPPAPDGQATEKLLARYQTHGADLPAALFPYIDAIIRFEPLQPETIRRIVQMQLAQFTATLQRFNTTLKVDPAVFDLLVEASSGAVDGAHPSRRMLVEQVFDPITRRIVTEDTDSSSTFQLTRAGDTIAIHRV